MPIQTDFSPELGSLVIPKRTLVISITGGYQIAVREPLQVVRKGGDGSLKLADPKNRKEEFGGLYNPDDFDPFTPAA